MENRRAGQHQNDQQRGQDKIDAQHRGVVARGPAVGSTPALKARKRLIARS